MSEPVPQRVIQDAPSDLLQHGLTVGRIHDGAAASDRLTDSVTAVTPVTEELTTIADTRTP